jgi:hypothetical protein
MVLKLDDKLHTEDDLIAKNIGVTILYSDMERSLYEFEKTLLVKLVKESIKSLDRQVYSITIHADRKNTNHIHSINMRLHYALLGDEN